MNRVEFLQKIYDDNDVGDINIIKDFFEQYMLLYDLTQRFPYKVEILHLNDKSGEFRLIFNSQDDLNNLLSKITIRQQQVEFYNKLFFVNLVDDNKDKSIIVNINNII